MTIPDLGSLSVTPLPALLYAAYQRRFTGVLFLIGEGQRAEVYLRDGYPCGVEAGGGDALDQVLLDAGLIDDRTFARLRERGVADGERVGRSLVEEGALTGEQLDGALRLQVRRRLFRLFAITQGDYVLRRGDHWVGLGGPQPIRVQPRRAIYQGIRSGWSAERVREAIRELDGQAVQLKTDEVQLSRYSLSPGDQVIAMALLERPVTIEEVAGATGQALPVVRAVVAALHFTAALQLSPAPKRPAARPPTSTVGTPADEGEAFPPEELTGLSSNALAALAGRGLGQLDVHALRGVIARQRRVFEEGDLFEVLGVGRDADDATLDAALAEALRALRADRLDDPTMESLRRDVEPLLARLREAYHTLRDEARRAAYVARLDQPK